MTPAKLYEALHALIHVRVPLHIWGACGVGKSQIVAQVAHDLDYAFLDVRAVQLDPVDLRGLPRIADHKTEWVPPKCLPTTGKGILFLDELTSAPQMTQAGCYQLVLDRKLGEYVLPDGWVVIAAGNPASERGVHFSMPRPLRNRFVHLDLEASLDDWCKWAIKSGVRPEIIAFLRFKPELLHAAETTSDANAWPTPRSWEMASHVLSGVASQQKTALLSGASEFEAQLLDVPSTALDRRHLAQSRYGATSHGDFGADRDRHGAWPRYDRQLARTGSSLSRTHADRNARDGGAGCRSARSRHHSHARIHPLRRGVQGGTSMITERAMLAAVHISIWTAVKHDRKISRDVASQHGAHQGAGRYNKQLLRGADKLDDLRTLAGHIRQYFYKITLPWSDEGFRLLPSNFYFDLMERMREFEASFEQGVESFLAVYPQYVEQVRPELNGLFREEDYPSAEKLRQKFGVRLEILPIPSGGDFRVEMSAEEQTRISREIDANVRQSLSRGTEDLWKRLRDVVSHMVERLNEPESRFHASLVTNVLDLVDILPRLNVRGDADLNRFADQAKQQLCNYSAQELKKNETLRTAAAIDAVEIVAQMDGVLRHREAATVPTEAAPTVDNIFAHMSAYMEAPTSL